MSGRSRGHIQEIYAEEGIRSKKGERIASLTDRDYLADLAQNQSRAGGKTGRLNLLKAAPGRRKSSWQKRPRPKPKSASIRLTHLEMDAALIKASSSRTRV